MRETMNRSAAAASPGSRRLRDLLSASDQMNELARRMWCAWLRQINLVRSVLAATRRSDRESTTAGTVARFPERDFAAVLVDTEAPFVRRGGSDEQPLNQEDRYRRADGG